MGFVDYLLEETDKQQKKIKKHLQEFQIPHIFISVNASPLQTGSLTRHRLKTIR
jgi:hypothetical protein